MQLSQQELLPFVKVRDRARTHVLHADTCHTPLIPSTLLIPQIQFKVFSAYQLPSDTGTFTDRPMAAHADTFTSGTSGASVTMHSALAPPLLITVELKPPPQPPQPSQLLPLHSSLLLAASRTP